MGCVDVTTGETMFFATDFSLPGFIALEFERTYQSSSNSDGLIGYGWIHNFDTFLRIQENKIIYQDHEGRQITFDLMRVGEQIYNPQDGLTLKRQASDFVLLMQDRQKLVFNNDGEHTNILRLRRIEDLNNNAIQFFYSKGLLSRIIDTVNRHLLFYYNDSGKLADIRLISDERKKESVRIVSYQYDQYGNLIAVLDGLRNRYTYEYEQHLMVKYTNRNGFSGYFQYDNKRRCTRTWKDGGFKLREIHYDEINRVNVIRNSHGYATTYKFNEAGLVTQEVDAVGNIINNIYDDNYDLLLITDESGQLLEPSIKYDAQKNPAIETDGVGGATFFTHNTLNQLTKLEDAEGNSWQWEYDERGNLTRALTPVKGEWKYENDDRGFLTKLIMPNSRIVQQKRSEDLRIITLSDEFGLIVKTEADLFGNTIAITDGLGNKQVLAHDVLGNLIEIKSPDGSTEHWKYDAEGNAILYTNRNGVEMQCEYDGWYLCTARVYPEEKRVTYIYDSEENLIEVINEKGERHIFTSNALGQVAQQKFFDGRIEKYEYNSRGDIVAIVDGNGHRAELEYDANSNLIKKRYSDGTKIAIEYDNLGRIKQAQTGDSFVEYQYDALSNVLKEIQSGTELEYLYDISGNRSIMRIEGGRERKYDYDKRDRLVRLEDYNAAIHEFEYDVLDRLIIHKMPNGLIKRWTYDDKNRTTQEQIVKKDETVLVERHWIFDPEGNAVEISDRKLGVTNYKYSPIERLETVTKNGMVAARYGYDTCGNLISMPDLSYLRYGTGNRLLQTSRASYEYDGNGNIVVKNQNDKKTHYEYNGEGQLTKIRHPSERITEYFYDPLGRRIKKIDEGIVTNFIWDDTSLLAEIRDDHNTVEYLFVPDTFFPLSQRREQKTYLYSTNDLATPTELFDDQGNMVWWADYKAFGEIDRGEIEQVINPFRFAGQYYDDETGFHYNWFRYYDPEIGRFTSFDPLAMHAGMNGYLYTLNPINWIDPYGLKARIATLPRYMENARARGVARAWAQERALLRAGNRGSRAWTSAERAIIRSGNVPPGWEGHHKRSVKHYYAKCKKIKNKCKKKQSQLRQKCREEAQRLAESPGNIQFVRNGNARSGRSGMMERNEHLAAHRGHFCNATHGLFNMSR